jgi:hypothetical protein
MGEKRPTDERTPRRQLSCRSSGVIGVMVCLGGVWRALGLHVINIQWEVGSSILASGICQDINFQCMRKTTVSSQVTFTCHSDNLITNLTTIYLRDAKCLRQLIHAKFGTPECD